MQISEPREHIPEPETSQAVAALRALRSWGYRLLSPLEKAMRKLGGGEHDLPPLWLRRHTGAPRHYRSAARATAEMIDRLSLLGESCHVLDIGCGCGAMAGELAARLGAGGRYTGFDVHEPCIAWCRRAFAEEKRFAFETARIASPYSHTEGKGSQSLDAYRFPAADETIDLVLAKSVFTHMTADDVAHYLREIARVLTGSGAALVTFFLFDGTRAPFPPAFCHPENRRSPMRWRRRRHAHAALAYDKSYIEESIAEAGLRVTSFIPGYWPGLEATLAGQDQLILTRS